MRSLEALPLALCGVVVLMAFSSGAARAALDPTRPPAIPAAAAGATTHGTVASAEPAPLPTLRYIRYSAAQRAAMIGEDLLGEGQSGHGVTVRRILPDAVVILHEGKEKTLRMFGPNNTDR